MTAHELGARALGDGCKWRFFPKACWLYRLNDRMEMTDCVSIDTLTALWCDERQENCSSRRTEVTADATRIRKHSIRHMTKWQNC